MADYELHYWPVPFRGQFVRAVLAHAGADWTEGDPGAIAGWMAGPVADMPVPFTGPPVLADRRAGLVLAQTPAILMHLGEAFALLPSAPGPRALTLKVVADANDVLDELTLDGGARMWTPALWGAFVPRLHRWMSLWEETGRRHGLKPEAGHLLGGDAPGLADLVTAVLWTTMADRLPRLGALLDEAAPLTAALARRVAALPALARLAERSREDWGEVWCGGEIEASLRAVLRA